MAPRKKRAALQPISDALRKMAADPDVHPAIRATIAGRDRPAGEGPARAATNP